MSLLTMVLSYPEFAVWKRLCHLFETKIYVSLSCSIFYKKEDTQKYLTWIVFTSAEQVNSVSYFSESLYCMDLWHQPLCAFYIKVHYCEWGCGFNSHWSYFDQKFLTIFHCYISISNYYIMIQEFESSQVNCS